MHSPSNGRIETHNKTIEAKVNNWMLEMNSAAGSIGCHYAA